MVKHKKIVYFLIVFIFLCVVNAITLAQDTKMYLKNQPIDFLSSGDDIHYQDWLSRYIQKREELAINMYNPKLQIITGDIKGDFIEYDPVSGVKGVSINFDKIKSIRNQGDLKGMFVDNGKIYVIVDKRKSDFQRFTEDIYVIIRGIYQSEDYCIWQTIDPPPNQADWDKYGVVYYGGDVENTHVGMVMFEADRIMKCLSSGYDNRTCERITTVKGLKTEWDYCKASDFTEGEEEWHRYWYTTQNANVQFDPKEKVVLLNGPPLTIETERMEMINGQLESTFDPDYNSPSYKWTQFFQTNIDYLAEYYPVLYEIQELARWTALFTALYETGFIIDKVDFDKTNFPYTKTPSKTPVLNIVQETTGENETADYVEVYTSQIILTGGVGLEQVNLQKSDLSDFKNEWLNKYKNDEQLVECIIE